MKVKMENEREIDGWRKRLQRIVRQRRKKRYVEIE